MRARRWTSAGVFLLAAYVCVGCATLNDPNVPDPIQKHVEPSYHSEYLTYRPSAYDRRDAWPLIVVCHGGFPDSPIRQLRVWTQLAERNGFIVVAPILPRSKGGWRSDPGRKFDELDDARRRIIAVTQHVRGAHTVSDDRVFIFGNGSGAERALFAGLAEPGVFRAMAVTDPDIDEPVFDRIQSGVDPYQNVLLAHHASTIFSGNHVEESAAWLRDRLAHIETDSASSDPESDAARVVGFFESVIRNSPWLRVVTSPGEVGDPMSVQFRLAGAPEGTAHRWALGDGDKSTVAEPVHRFREAGLFRVTVSVEGPHGSELTRFVDVSVPRAPIELLGQTP